ncbi:TPA: Abi family protein [Yersinia enterocolitica]
MSVERIIESISGTRIATYERCFETTDISESLGMYIWNKRVCAELLPVLQILEVSLRNTLCSGYESLFRERLKQQGKNITEINAAFDSMWLKNFYDSATDSQYKETKSAIASAVNKLEKRGIELTADNLIPELTFGVWSHLCQSHNISDDQSLKLWPDLLYHAFPGRKMKHSQLINILRSVNRLRNRIAHHEPVWYSKSLYGTPAYLNKVINFYNECLILIEAINPSNLKAITLVNSHASLTTLCSVQCIEEYKNLATEVHAIPQINIKNWHTHAQFSERIRGAISSIQGDLVSIKAVDGNYSGQFFIDKKDKAILMGLEQLKVGELVTFIPTRFDDSLIATKVHYNLPT